MSLRILLPISGMVLLALAGAACGDDSAETQDGGDALDCPEQEPGVGSACSSTFPDECHYPACPDDPNGGGYRNYECVDGKVVETGSDAMCTPTSGSSGATGGGEGGSGGGGEGGSGATGGSGGAGQGGGSGGAGEGGAGGAG